MKLLLRPFFLVCFVVFALHQIFEKLFSVQVVFLDNYLDSFLCLPIVLSLYLVERRFFSKKPDYTFPLFDFVIISIALSIFFEEALPLISTKFTKDYYDYVALLLGAIMFWFLGNKKS